MLQAPPFPLLARMPAGASAAARGAKRAGQDRRQRRRHAPSDTARLGRQGPGSERAAAPWLCRHPARRRRAIPTQAADRPPTPTRQKPHGDAEGTGRNVQRRAGCRSAARRVAAASAPATAPKASRLAERRGVCNRSGGQVGRADHPSTAAPLQQPQRQRQPRPTPAAHQRWPHHPAAPAGLPHRLGLAAALPARPSRGRRAGVRASMHGAWPAGTEPGRLMAPALAITVPDQRSGVPCSLRQGKRGGNLGNAGHSERAGDCERAGADGIPCIFPSIRENGTSEGRDGFAADCVHNQPVCSLSAGFAFAASRAGKGRFLRSSSAACLAAAVQRRGS